MILFADRCGSGSEFRSRQTQGFVCCLADLASLRAAGFLLLQLVQQQKRVSVRSIKWTYYIDASVPKKCVEAGIVRSDSGSRTFLHIVSRRSSVCLAM